MLDLDRPDIGDLEPYPTSDGRPMGETDFHRQQMMDLIVALESHFRDEQDVYVSGNILMFYEEGNRRRHLSPDVLVTLGIDKRKRQQYKIWEEGKAPDLVIEVTSASTRLEDLGEKKGLYAVLGVKELCLFDPREEYLKPRLRVYRLQGEDYISVIPPNELKTVGLKLEVLENSLRLTDPATGQRLHNIEEMKQDLQREHERAEREAERAERESERAEREAERAEQERLRAEILAQRLRELGEEP